MGLETIALVSAGLQIAQGFMSYREQKKAEKADRRAAEERRRQADIEARLTEEDAKRAAEEEIAEAEKTRSRQKTLFLKSGVVLEGSPLLVMEETREKGAENAQNVTDAAKRRADLIRRQGNVNTVQRADLFGTALSTAGNVTSTIMAGKQLA